MSEEVTAYTPITVEQITAFHKAKNVQTNCERCGNPTWRMLTASPLVPAVGLPLAMTNASVDPTVFLPVYVLTCSNCGNVWLMDRALFDEWNTPTAAVKEEP